jgi:hypothetical protein
MKLKKRIKYPFGFKNPESLTKLNLTPEEENELFGCSLTETTRLRFYQ